MSHLHLCPRVKLSGVLAPFAMGVVLVLSGCDAEAPAGPSMEAAAPEPSAAPTAPAPPAASEVPEGTDVWLLELVQEGGALRAKSPRNLTHRPGYDNQPSFSPQGDVLFVQMEDERTDLWRWSRDTERATRVTLTVEESEFSPTPIPDSEGGISYIRSKTDTSGRLWRMPQEGADAEIVFADIGPVGYHAW
ncbi:MAG: hypothetical protein NWQ45_13510, partial [Congregibacter sp.]|nr:hypothetical protein [Congregibacter sp.]